MSTLAETQVVTFKRFVRAVTIGGLKQETETYVITML